VYNHCNIYNISIYFCNIHIKHLQHSDETFETLETYFCNICFQRVMSPCCLDESRSSTPPWHMELAGMPLGEDMLGVLGEHLCEAREHLLQGLGQRTLDAAEDGLGAAGDRSVAGDGGGGARQGGLAGSAPERCALEAVARHALAGPVAERWLASGWEQYVDELIFLVRNRGAGSLGLAWLGPPTVHPATRTPVS
jgi:hypothetical protein